MTFTFSTTRHTGATHRHSTHTCIVWVNEDATLLQSSCRLIILLSLAWRCTFVLQQEAEKKNETKNCGSRFHVIYLFIVLPAYTHPSSRCYTCTCERFLPSYLSTSYLSTRRSRHSPSSCYRRCRRPAPTLRLVSWRWTSLCFSFYFVFFSSFYLLLLLFYCFGQEASDFSLLLLLLLASHYSFARTCEPPN